MTWDTVVNQITIRLVIIVTSPPQNYSVRITIVLIEVQGVPIATELRNKDVATKFEQEYVRCVRNEEECVCSACL